MAKRRGLASSFDDVAGQGEIQEQPQAETPKQRKPRTPKKTEVMDVHSEYPDEMKKESAIQSLLEDASSKKVFVGVYFDPDVNEALATIVKGKKGALSKIVNEAVKRLLQQEGIM